MNKFVFFFILALVAGTATVVAEEAKTEEPADDAVMVLTQKNFKDALKENELILVKFYAPWCGHCKRMAPEYAKAAKKLKDAGSKVILAKVDAVAETEIADEQNAHEFPTLTFFRNEKPEKYTGGRTAEAIIEWIDKMTGPAVGKFEGEPEKKLSKDSPIVLFGEFKEEGNAMDKMFEEVANASRQHAKFYCKYGAAEDKIYGMRFEEGTFPFTGKTAEEFTKFVDEESYPLFGPINGENFRKYIDREQSLAWFCGEQKDFDEYKTNIRSAAKSLRKEFSFVWLDTDQFKGHAENALGISDFPGLVIQTKKGRFVLPDASSTMKDADKVKKFGDDVLAGKIERSLKSEPIPETNTDAVKIIVGKTFEDMVLQDKDVFLEIYAPWCGYCKSFEPVYKEFAEKVKDVDHVVVAKMDGTANETPRDEFEWNSFPTIFYIKAGEKTPMKFEGSRTVDGLMEFLEKNTSKPLPKKSDKSEEL